MANPPSLHEVKFNLPTTLTWISLFAIRPCMSGMEHLRHTRNTTIFLISLWLLYYQFCFSSTFKRKEKLPICSSVATLDYRNNQSPVCCHSLSLIHWKLLTICNQPKNTQAIFFSKVLWDVIPRAQHRLKIIIVVIITCTHTLFGVYKCVYCVYSKSQRKLFVLP